MTRRINVTMFSCELCGLIKRWEITPMPNIPSLVVDVIYQQIPEDRRHSGQAETHEPRIGFEIPGRCVESCVWDRSGHENSG